MDLRPALPQLLPMPPKAVPELRPLGPQAMALAKDNTADAAKIDKVARDFESLFAKMLISSMRQTSFGDELMGNDEKTFRDMYDQQLAKTLSAGQGLGLAPAIKRQLAAAQGSAETSALPTYIPLGGSAAAPAPEGATSIDTSEPAPVQGSYHRPASTRTPAWLSSRSQATDDRGHFDLRAATGPEATATPALPAHAFTRLPPIPTAPAAPVVSSKAARGTPEAFVARIWPQAQRAAAELGVDPKMLVAQAALETGWGRHVVGRGNTGEGGNLFGIKAGRSWEGDAVRAATREFAAGRMVTEEARFRSYDSVEASFNDYVALLKTSPRYADTLRSGGDGRRFAQSLARAGYATDPHYANKLIAIAEGPTLRRALGQLNSGPVLADNDNKASPRAMSGT
ncbi:MAG TPA: flagellar assembly peptidoglycan hydrolase FlgJ [Arenimonas sp.]|nr:flagellar assembly peptidoglycan hydrolase FlgJ [Arenimonas sp.]